MLNQNLHIPFSKAVLQPLIPQSVQISRVAPSKVQSLAFALVKLHAVDECSGLLLVMVFLQNLCPWRGSQQLLLINVICKLT